MSRIFFFLKEALFILHTETRIQRPLFTLFRGDWVILQIVNLMRSLCYVDLSVCLCVRWIQDKKIQTSLQRFKFTDDPLLYRSFIEQPRELYRSICYLVNHNIEKESYVFMNFIISKVRHKDFPAQMCTLWNSKQLFSCEGKQWCSVNQCLFQNMRSIPAPILTLLFFRNL